MEKVLVLNGSFCEIPLIEECHKLGYYVYTTGNMPNLCGHRYADKYICADYSDYEAIHRIVRENGIDHVITCANDFGSITAAYVDEKKGWGHHDTFANAQLMHHKDLFKEYMLRNGFPTPTSRGFSDMESALAFVNSGLDFPLIIKANDLTGGKGITRANTVPEAVAALELAFKMSRSKHVVIEEFIVGEQQTFVTFLRNRKVIAHTGCDSYSYVNPYLIQLETLPANGLDVIRGRLVELIEEMAEDLRLADGIFAVQYVRNGSEFHIFEMMRRPFGNQFLRLVEDCTDFPWHLAQITAETGGDWNLVKRKPVVWPYCGHFGVMTRANGKVASISIPADIRNHVIREFQMKGVGDEIRDYRNERVTYLHFAYDNYEEMAAAASRMFERIKVEIV